MPGDLFIHRIETQRKIGGEHRWTMFFGAIECIGNDIACILRHPLMRTGRALRELVFEIEKVLEKIIAPFGRSGGPGNFQSAGNGIGPFT